MIATGAHHLHYAVKFSPVMCAVYLLLCPEQVDMEAMVQLVGVRQMVVTVHVSCCFFAFRFL